MKNISVIMPCFNEKNSVTQVLNQVNEVMSKQDWGYEIIVVNDASNDGTEHILSELKGNFKLISNKTNFGYGGSIKKGVEISKYEAVLIIDADGTYPVQALPGIINHFFTDDYDMVIGARIKKGSAMPFIRRPAKWIIGLLANYLSGTKIPDVNSGLRIMKKHLVMKHLKILPNGFSFTTTITIAMLTNHNTVYYMPIDYYARKGRSKIHPINDTLTFIFLIVRTVMLFNPLKIFVPAAALFMLAAVVIFFYSYFYLHRLMDATVTVLIVTSVQLLFLGMIADMIDRRMQ
ncbi:MAG: glycosyltransferase family 2 protein [Candidatus Omnitrophota bacterium]